MDKENQMTENKVALITGANKGLGLEIARQLGRQGITVVLGSRDPAKGQAAADTLKSEGIDAHTVKLEVTDAGDVAALPAFFADKFGRLDILVNNAGVFPESTGPITLEAFHAGLTANVIAPYFLTETLLPLLLAAPAGRIVNHSSLVGSLTTMGSDEWPTEYLFPIYSSSKAALNMLTVIHAKQHKETALKVNAAHPGNIKTDMNAYGDLTVEEGAKTAVMLATLPDDGPTGGYFYQGSVLPW